MYQLVSNPCCTALTRTTVLFRKGVFSLQLVLDRLQGLNGICKVCGSRVPIVGIAVAQRKSSDVNISCKMLSMHHVLRSVWAKPKLQACALL